MFYNPLMRHGIPVPKSACIISMSQPILPLSQSMKSSASKTYMSGLLQMK